ncbi:family 16 glycosylhydrolase [Polaribacter sp. SA4-12]|uniref:family 16 glycosylhydrolase n=1 Tax=Polaribacter sp. SA4-12 TaxID=1312072 RepID=UPI000B3C8088|nr:family 16 glycosylhydrolase [Polaribacter sp. SA4-12]ARV16565.1 glycoside hydrolase [Polaribacter sp. SA4-12]
MKLRIIIVTIFLVFNFLKVDAQQNSNKINLNEWKLVWNDEFDYNNEKLDEKWVSQNGPSGHILCSRWRENAVVKNGVLELQARKENKGGQEWTAGNIWTKKRFKYGYFECRYRYAAAEATNNSFWLMTKGSEPTEGKRFEIDINEGHFPNEVSTNIHQWSDFTIDKNGKKKHQTNHKGFTYGAKPDYTIQLETPIETKKIRFISNNQSRFNLGEFRVYSVNKDGNYPNALSTTADTDIPGLVNYTKSNNISITTSGSFKGKDTSHSLTDGNPFSSWTTQNSGEKWVEFTWEENITVGATQFVNGWKDGKGNWYGLISDYKVQYLKDGVWKDIAVLDVEKNYNFAEEYHTYGLEWNEQELIFYFDGKEIRREKNTFCFSETPIWLSVAIIKWSGTVTDAIDGISMKVDYVRYYNKK